MGRELINIKQIDTSKLNDVKIYDELPLEVEGQVAYCTADGKLYYGDGSQWKEISGGGLPDGTVEGELPRWNGSEWVTTSSWFRIDNDAYIYVDSWGNGTSNQQVMVNASGMLYPMIPPTIPPAQIQSDWNQSNNTQVDYIKNKPVIPPGLPSGTANQLLRNNGADWTSTVNLNIIDTAGSTNIGTKEIGFNKGQYYSSFDGSFVKYYQKVQDGNNVNNKTISRIQNTYQNSSVILSKYYESTSYSQEISMSVGLSHGFRASSDGGNGRRIIIDLINTNVIEYSTGITTNYIKYFSIESDGTIFSNTLVGDGDRYIVADSTGKLKVVTNTMKHWKEVIVPISVPTSIVAITDVDLGLTGIDLTTKVKVVQSFYKLSGTTIYDNSNIVGEQIQTNMITANISPALGNGDSFKLYIEYID